jgi:hypothetical protein
MAEYFERKKNRFRQPQLPLLRNSVNKRNTVSVSATATCGSLNENGVGFSNCHLAEKIGKTKIGIGFQQLPIAEKK